MLSQLVSLATVVTTAFGHAALIKPAPRRLGAGFEDTCGIDVVGYLAEKGGLDSWYTNPPDNIAMLAKPGCDLFFCRGAVLEDGFDLVQSYPPGSVVDMEVEFLVLHSGWANVSIVDLHNKLVVGTPLISWDSYGDRTVSPTPADQTKFAVTIPDLGGKCSQPGDCALQWWWYRPPTDRLQHWLNCVDFVQ